MTATMMKRKGYAFGHYEYHDDEPFGGFFFWPLSMMNKTMMNHWFFFFCAFEQVGVIGVFGTEKEGNQGLFFFFSIWVMGLDIPLLFFFFFTHPF